MSVAASSVESPPAFALPPPRRCDRCKPDPGTTPPLMTPVHGSLEQCHGASLPAVVFRCNACGTVTTEPLRRST